MQQFGPVGVRLKSWKLEKRTADGVLFEVVEGEGDTPTRVTFRREGVAPIESYAMGLPYVRAIDARDAAGVLAVDAQA